jgi:hypothetical protein
VPDSPVRNTVASAEDDDRRHIEMMLDTGLVWDYSPKQSSPTHRQSHSNGSPHKSSSTHSEDQLCKVCFEAQINTVLLRCGHMAVCKGCTKGLDKCPICRSIIDEVIQTYRV